MDNKDKEQFEVTWRCDEEEYFCTDSLIIYSDCIDVLDFVKEHERQLKEINKNNTILLIERIL
jgi:hypothetical protein